MKGRLVAALAGVSIFAFAVAVAGDAVVVPFSASKPAGPLPGAWRVVGVPKARPAQVDLVEDEGATVLRVRSVSAAGAAAYSTRAPVNAHPVLQWRWKIDRVVEQADMQRRSGDDFAARVYVLFDIPEDELPMLARIRVQLARLLYGTEVPPAALCYVWDNRHSPETSAWSSYTDRVRMIVVESGSVRAGRWVEVRRDLEADFRAAFGAQWRKPTPDVIGLVAGNDTDQTKESATAWFADFRFVGRP